METKYVKDFRHNYLVADAPQHTADSYQCKMITGNRISGLLPCQEKHMNGDTFLYYDISSRQTLQSLYENKTISAKLLKSLFVQLKMTWEEMAKFLLDENRLVLRPEYIFADAEKESFSFLYYPFEEEENYFTCFLEFLLDKVDKEDKKAVEIVYQMYELVEREQFMPDEVLIWFEQDYGEESQQPEQDDLRFCVNAKDMSTDGEAFTADENVPVSQGKTDSGERQKKARLGICFAAVAGTVLFYLYRTYQFSEREQIYFYAVSAAAAAVFLLSLFCLIWERFFGENRCKNREPEFLEKKKTGQVISERNTWEPEDEKEESYFGNTVFIPWVEKCENKLYGMGRGNKNHIDLSRLPLTVGKLAGSVDMVISDQSISRRHVKFIKEGNRVCMTDLNSTNGTFKNGLRLEPNATEVLEPGDEIRLGKLKFIYR